ncbi:hypothetical protein ACIQ6K_30645 [Streptomyces sp. NPDC096354]|uniref:hypothetical protein n=1 Tax=Streptomyces sp. NPDC096354 TaxID=3366088 RepID=UPI0037F65372
MTGYDRALAVFHRRPLADDRRLPKLAAGSWEKAGAHGDSTKVLDEVGNRRLVRRALYQEEARRKGTPRDRNQPL